MSSVVISPIGVNLCQSVDEDAKGAKDTKDAKINAETQRKQRRREVQREKPQITQISTDFSLCAL